MSDVTSIEWCGIDTGKKNLDAGIRRDVKNYWTRRVANNVGGFEKLLEWALLHVRAGAELRFCLESTGDYGLELSLFLTERGYHVSMVNPARVKYFGIYKGRLNKTDKADAKLIADYACESHPEVWALADPVKRKLFRLHRRRQQLIKLETAESNRRECPSAIGPECEGSIKRMLKTIRAELRFIEAELEKVVRSDVRLQRAAELIASVPVFAAGTAQVLLAEMPPVESCDSAKSWAAASGVNPTNRQSGEKASLGRMSRGGRRAVRKQCWMPALVGLGSMPELRAFYDNLRGRGKTHKQALTACVRKLLMIVYGILKHQTPYRPPTNKPAPATE